MKINPNNGQFTLSEFANRVLIPKMSANEYMGLGFKLGNPENPSIQAHFQQKTFSFFAIQFQEGRLRTITLGTDSDKAKNHLKQLGIKPQAYSWGDVKLGSHAQSGEMWIEIRYK
jgi:hypothetical protein